MAATTIMLYGRTGAGKTTQIGLLAEDIFKKTKKKTRLCTADYGGLDTLMPYVNLGIIEVVEKGDTDPWIWTNKVTTGFIRDAAGKWVLDKAANDNVGLICFESAQAIAKAMKSDMEAKAALGINVGGDTNTTFEVKGDGESLKVGTTKGYQKFGIPQDRVYASMLQSTRLPMQYVLWTAGISKDDDEIGTSKVVGPDVLGKALIGVIPQIFNYTFRIDVTPAMSGKPPVHILYLGAHQDISSGNAMALGNIRRPLDAPPLLKLTVEPANIVTALSMVRDEAQKLAQEVIRKRMGL